MRVQGSGRRTTDETDGTDKSLHVSRKGAKGAKFQTRKEKIHHPLRWMHGDTEKKPEEVRPNQI